MYSNPSNITFYSKIAHSWLLYDVIKTFFTNLKISQTEKIAYLRIWIIKNL